jgi:hypothetical protein
VNRESEDTTKPALPGDNVVRLPRDWLGPREELVPLEGTTGAAASAGAPPRADDFWGEDSAALQDPWQAPEDTGPAVVSGGGVRQARWRGPAFAYRGRRRVAASVALVAAVAATGIGVAYAGSGASRQRSGDRPAARLAADTKLHVGHARVSQTVTYRKPPVHHPQGHHPRVRHRRLPVKHMGKGGTPAHTRSTSAPQTSSSTPTAVPTTTGSSGTSFVANPTPQHEDSMAPATKSSSGPTGAGAPFAPGYIP